MREVTIYNFDDPERRKTIYSDSGVMGMTPDQKDLQMTLHDGYMQQIPRDNLGELTRLYFKTDLVRVRGVGNRFEQTEKDDYKSEREMSVCEMSNGLAQGNQDLDQARATLANTLVAATHYLATGEQLPAAKAPKPEPRLTAGGLYCKLSSPIFGNARDRGLATASARSAHGARRRSRRAQPPERRSASPSPDAPTPAPSGAPSGVAARRRAASRPAQARRAERRARRRRAEREAQASPPRTTSPGAPARSPSSRRADDRGRGDAPAPAHAAASDRASSGSVGSARTSSRARRIC